MAPMVSPKKSWEGFGGSTVACALSAGLLFPLTLHGAWWQGVVFGLAVVVAATVGDLSESLIKRDLGIKDMGNLLPGHGGVMDRFDSLLLAAPVAWALLTLSPVAEVASPEPHLIGLRGRSNATFGRKCNHQGCEVNEVGGTAGG